MKNLSIKNKKIILFGCTGVLGSEFVNFLTAGNTLLCKNEEFPKNNISFLFMVCLYI